jgi:regulator of sigma E protease
MTHIILSVFGFILMLGLLILIHELGHFIAAKLFGVKVQVFSIGFVGSIFSFRLGETLYRLGWIPLGGYVKMQGDADDAPTYDPDLQKRSFTYKPLWQRAIIILAGPMANLLILPIVAFTMIYMTKSTDISTVVGMVLPEYPADKAGLLPDDRIISIDGKPVRYFRDLVKIIEKAPNKTLQLEIERESHTIKVPVTPQLQIRKDLLNSEQKRGIIGVYPNFRTAEIGISDPKSPAHIAGLRTWDQIVAINDKQITRLEQIAVYIEQHPARSYRLKFRRLALYNGTTMLWQTSLPPQEVTILPQKQQRGDKVIYYTGIESSELYVRTVHPGTPLAKAGVQIGDRLIEIAGQPIRSAADLSSLPQKADQTYTISFMRDGQTLHRKFELFAMTWIDPLHHAHRRVILGIELSTPYSAGQTTPINNRLSYSLSRAIDSTLMLTSLITRSIFKLFTRELPADSIGGPIMIFQIAQQAVKSGWETFFTHLILISINLGLINLLPIPVLDGGHLMFFLIEAIIRRPVPPRIKHWALIAGLVLLLFLVIFALKNDIQRVISSALSL